MRASVPVEQFAYWLKLGLGRAVLHLQKHDAAPYREVILNACLNYMGHDRQTDCSRTDYMFDMINLTQEKDFYRDQILQALRGDWEAWDSQVFDLAFYFARDGEAEARRVLYNTFLKNIEVDHAHGDGIIKLEGVDGFKFVARHIGTKLLDGEDVWDDEYLLDVLKEQLGDEEYSRTLARLCADDTTIRSFVEAVAANRARRKSARVERSDPAAVSYDDFRSVVIDGARSSITPTSWGKTASPNELLRAAEDLLRETKPAKVRKLLRVFWRRPFPLAPDRLIELAQNSDDRVASHAFSALGVVAHPSVRAFAFQLMQMTDKSGWLADLLVRNYEEGDHALIEELAIAVSDEHEFHRLGIGVRKFFKTHPNPETEIRVLTHLYEKNPCSFCRERTVERLIQLDSLLDWMAQECLWDANVDTRKLVKHYLQQADSENNQQSAIINQQSRSV